MSEIEWTSSSSDFGKRVKGGLSMLRAAGGPDADAEQEFENLARPMQQEIEGHGRERQRIRGDAGLSDVGRVRALEAHGAKMATAGAAIVAKAEKRFAEIEAALEAHETHAAEGRSWGRLPDGDGGYGWIGTPPPERSVEVILAEREVRDVYRADLASGKMRATEPRQRYLAAVRDGSDPLLVSALERAPASAPLIDANTVREAREIKIAKSPDADKILRLQTARQAYGYLRDAVRMEFPETSEERLRAPR